MICYLDEMSSNLLNFQPKKQKLHTLGHKLLIEHYIRDKLPWKMCSKIVKIMVSFGFILFQIY